MTAIVNVIIFTCKANIIATILVTYSDTADSIYRSDSTRSSNNY